MSKSNKVSIPSLRRLIKEERLDREYRERFVENFKDVRDSVLTEEQLDSIADHLYEMIFKK